MYHAIILEDLLDCISVCTAFPEAVIHQFSTVVAALREAAVRMLQWLVHMTHPDGGSGAFKGKSS